VLSEIGFDGRIVVASSIYADFSFKTVYGFSKCLLEQVAEYYIGKNGLRIDIVRL